MKKIFWAFSFLLFTMIACNKSQDNVTPSSDQKVLGLVIDNGGSMILLKDGRTISPMTTPDHFKVDIGSKYLFSFVPLSTSQDKKLSYVKIISYSNAQDSTFTPPTSGSDSTAALAFLQGNTFRGNFTYATVDYSHPADTSKMTGPASIAFGTHYDYVSTPSPNGYPAGGSGSFILSTTNSNVINFVNTTNFPAGTNPGLILNGQYNYLILDNSYLLLWTYTNNSFSSYSLHK